jgi:hypothetical protein
MTHKRLIVVFHVDPDWHLIFGGLSTTLLNTVELYNWKTGLHCLLPSLPYEVFQQVSIVMEGTPVFCGGQSNTAVFVFHCFKLVKQTQTWVQVSLFFTKININILLRSQFIYFYFFGFQKQSF